MNYATRFFIIIIFLATFRVASATSDNDSRTMRLFDNPEIVSPKYNSFCLDSRGYLWIGSETGLVRFDGINYETFRHDDKIPGSISTNRISKIMCDSRGDIWVATADGLNLYDQKSNSFREVTLPGVGLKGYIMDLTEQSDGSIAFIVAGVGIYVVDNKDENLEGVKIGFIPEHAEPNSLISIPNGGLMAGTHFGDILRIQANGNTQRVHLTPEFFVSMCREKDGKILAYSASGIWRINAANMDVKQINTSPIAGHNINAISICPDGVGYIATNGKGIWRIEPGAETITPVRNMFHPTIDINTNKLGAIYMAPDSNLWVGCNYHGVLMAPSKPMPFSYHPLVNSIHDFHGGITAMTADESGIWLALEESDLIRISSDHEVTHRIRIPSGHEIRALHRADNGTIYAASIGNGIYEISPATGQMKQLFSLNSSAIRFCLAGGVVCLPCSSAYAVTEC